MSTEIGKRNRKVDIQQEIDSSGSDGAFIKIWTTIKSPFVEFLSETTKEFYKMQQRFIDTEIVLKTWYIKDITTDMRIQYGERIFRINGVVDIGEQHRELLISCKGWS